MTHLLSACLGINREYPSCYTHLDQSRMEKSAPTHHHLSPVTAPTISKDFHLGLRQRFLNKLNDTLGNSLPQVAICLFKGIQTLHRNWEDVDYKVEQESNFWYFFGVDLADCYASIDISSGHTILFVPRLDEAYKLWMVVLSNQEIKEKFRVNEVKCTDEIETTLASLNPSEIYVVDGVCSDSGLPMHSPAFPFLSKYHIQKKTLYSLICNLRVIKTEEELEILKYVSRIGSQAHLSAMKSTKKGLMQSQISAVFQFQHSIRCGCERLGFNSINASGQDCATLHYIDNEKVYQSGQMSLQDMGGRWYGYVTDQAITFPVDGKFTQKQRQIYTAVYQAQKTVAETAKEGVSWTDMHLLAERVILKHLIQLGLVTAKETDIEELVEKRVGAVFFPHGLGHFVGLLVHDVGGYVEGEQRSTEAGLKSLRTRRRLESNMVLTIEPGLYFIEQFLNRAYNDSNLSGFLNREKIEEYKEVGGVRLEDVFIVRKTHVEKISNLPRTVEEVEAFLAS